ncbi:hypothetical protein LWM68_40625 [Niabella sp. W65]|nr:hypothetical protein [Niabella sp. W65]MCH7368484.1 hypothetical protein [Niabella sp. W65]
MSQEAFTDDVNGASTADATFRSMAAAPDGSIYVTINEGSSVLYLAKFQPGPGGTATNFQMLGNITINGGAPAAALRNGDIAFDGSGNLYALINEDAPQGNATIYFVAASGISTSNAGTTNLQARYDVKNSSGTNFSDYAVGLAVASSGNFYLAIQGNPGWHLYVNPRCKRRLHHVGITHQHRQCPGYCRSCNILFSCFNCIACSLRRNFGKNC